MAILDMARKFVEGRGQRNRAKQLGQITAIPEQLFKLLAKVQKAGDKRICTPLQQIIAAGTVFADDSTGVLNAREVKRLTEIVHNWCP